VLVGTSATPLSITSASNTTTNVIPGVTLTLTKADPNTAITVDLATDGAAMTKKISDFVDAANAILKEIHALTDYDAAAKKSGVLGADGAVRRLASQILSDFSNAVGGATASSAGIQLDRNGLITLDKTKLEAAYAANPAKVQALFFSADPLAPGIAQRIEKTADRADDRVFGVLTNAIEGRRSQVRNLDLKIADWDVRLARKEAMLRRQFSALETALGASQSQGNWLAGQISGLPKWE
jgi:flagellar hook-associated protein 2